MLMTEYYFIQEFTRCSTELTAFLKESLEILPITVRSFEKDNHIDGDGYERAYKNLLSGYLEWSELEHADEWLIFPQNIGPHLSIG